MCSVKVPQATGGSRADGVIEMTYQHGSLQKPEVDWAKTRSDAAERCKAWGFDAAEVFGGSTNQCIRKNGYGSCIVWQVSKKYQCIQSN